MIFIFPCIGSFIIPTDFHIFQRGRYTTNQISIDIFGEPWLTTWCTTSIPWAEKTQKGIQSRLRHRSLRAHDDAWQNWIWPATFSGFQRFQQEMLTTQRSCSPQRHRKTMENEEQQSGNVQMYNCGTVWTNQRGYGSKVRQGSVNGANRFLPGGQKLWDVSQKGEHPETTA